MLYIFQISNRKVRSFLRFLNVVTQAVLSYVILEIILESYRISLIINCNVFALRVILCKTLKKKGRAFRNIGLILKYISVSLQWNQPCFLSY